MDYIKCLVLFLLNPTLQDYALKGFFSYVVLCLFVLGFLLFCSRKGLTMQPWLSWLLLYTRQTLSSQRFICLCLCLYSAGLQLKHALAHPVFSSIIKNFYIDYKDFLEKRDYEVKVPLPFPSALPRTVRITFLKLATLFGHSLLLKLTTRVRLT